jgi:hypothetical protein
MRKITLELEPNEMVRGMFRETFEHIDSYEVLESLKIDRDEAICIDLIECVVKEDRAIEDMTTIGVRGQGGQGDRGHDDHRPHGGAERPELPREQAHHAGQAGA